MVGTKTSGNRFAVYNGPFCGAKTRAGGSCRAPAMSNGRCRVHGGSQPKGFLSPNWKHGRYSKYLGPVLGPLVVEQLADPDRLSMDRELALIDARSSQLLQRIGEGGQVADWAAMHSLISDFNAAGREGKQGIAKMHRIVEKMTVLAQEGAGESAAWVELRSLIDQRRVLVESEERRAVSSGKAVPADQVMNLIAVLGRIVMEEVPDPKARAKISERFVQAVHGKRLDVNALPSVILKARPPEE